ncbi:SpoIIE family protein phosphatase [bacterium]|nr:SpoIIE family protein phosphatase [bacterium]
MIKILSYHDPMVSETRFQIATTLRKGVDEISQKWADVIASYYDDDITREELARRSKVAIEILANLLEGEDLESFRNFYRKLALEWITIGGTSDELRNLKNDFLKICENRFAFIDNVEDGPGELIKELDDFLEKELWQRAASEYLAVFESEVSENLSGLPDSNESLRRLLKLTGRLGGLIDAGDIWEELLYEMREIFPSMDAGAVFLYVNGRLSLKGIVGFEDFVYVRNDDEFDFSFYSTFDRRLGINVTNIANLDNPEKVVFCRRRLKDDNVEKEYPSQILSLPLIASDTRKGLVCLYGFDKKSFFNDDEIALLEILSTNIKSALVRSETIANLNENRRDGEFLMDLQKRLSGINSPVDLGKTFLDCIKGHLGDMRSVIYSWNETDDGIIPLVSLETIAEPGEIELSALYTFAFERKAPIFLASLKENPVLEGILPPLELVKPDNEGALGIIPLMAGNEIIGMWGFAVPQISDLSEGKRLFLILAANIFTYSLRDVLANMHIREQHEIRGREIKLAASLQQNLVPRYYRGRGYEVEITLIAGGDLAGDFAFLEPVKKDELVIAIGDVSGRGIAAGMSMMSAYGLLGELSKTHTSPGDILERLNKRLREQYDKTLPPFLDETFVTCFVIDAHRDGTVRYAKAGHLPPIVYRANDESSEVLDARGVPLGIFADSIFEEHETKLNPGDSLLLFTDGITEARDDDGEEFGVEKLKELVKRWHAYPPVILQKLISYEFERHVPPGTVGDDRTWIVLKRELDGWKDFRCSTKDKVRRRHVAKVTDFIETCPIISEPEPYAHLLNEAVRAADDRGQPDVAVRIFMDNDRFHLVIQDTDPELRKLGSFCVGLDSNVEIPSTREAISRIRSDVDFIWYNSVSRELNIYRTSRGNEHL